eukprot:CAMPEP_0202434162 /NCGR_PEP_ID=MMETSP1345-20130828/14503_1 /ASSEMBLY_ACC=CAM_ASM_000843 /TAXON_ID=342563 /ORGANISM="Fabrea Fabrea salina" /LENGTH=559 /DNA_ID=CAMNT_0049046757 /DNA_START=5 /DNA_END=1681 /DNA_ORIENTATION=+
MTDEEFSDLCFDFGLELDDITSEKEIVAKEQGEEAAAGLDETILYKIEVPANRYDLLCVEGLSQALRVFTESESPPKFRKIEPAELQVMKIEEPTQKVRPYVVCAVLRDVVFTSESYKSFIDLQDKLHQNICRGRTLVAIGTHDLDTLKGPFTYTAKPFDQVKFKALNQETEMTAEELMQKYKSDVRMKHYVPIIEHSDVCPVIYDSQGIVLSMPPIINGDHSKITLDTKNVFIEMTATDLTKAHIVLHAVVAAFSQYCEDIYTVEPVKVINSKGEASTTPIMDERDVEVSVSYVNKTLGVELSPKEVSNLLTKMSLESKVTGEDSVGVHVPITRPDVLHPCDVAEDVGIAYSYNKIVKRLPKVHTFAKQNPLNHFTDLLRAEVAQAGYTEILTFSLLSFEDNYTKLRRKPKDEAVEIANPKTVDFQMPRTSLLPGLFKTIVSNKTHSLPIQIFEISDVVKKQGDQCYNERKMSAMYCNKTSGFEVVHGVMDFVMTKLGLKFQQDYRLEKSQDEAFFEGRQAQVILKNKPIGVIGIVHPEVLANFEIRYPVSAMELDVE